MSAKIKCTVKKHPFYGKTAYTGYITMYENNKKTWSESSHVNFVNRESAMEFALKLKQDWILQNHTLEVVQ